MTDRPLVMVGSRDRGQIRRLMYQALICGIGRPPFDDNPRRLAATLNAEDVEGAADALINGMGGDAELSGNLL